MHKRLTSMQCRLMSSGSLLWNVGGWAYRHGKRHSSSLLGDGRDASPELGQGQGDSVEILTFDRKFDRASFNSGKKDLDDWLKTNAGQQERANNTRTFLAVEGDRVIGYYATTAYRLGLDEVARMYGTGKRVYPIPAVLLARLAVDKSHQSRGLGSGCCFTAWSRSRRLPAALDSKSW